MSLAETIKTAGGQAAISHVAQRFGLDEAVAAKAIGMLLPALSQGMQRNASAPTGAAALFEALQTDGHARYLNEPSSLAEPATRQDGIGILGHVLGNKDVSRAVASTVSAALGIENETVKQMLPVVAAMAMAGLAKQTQAQPSATPASDLAGQLGTMLNVSNAAGILGSLFG